MKNSIIAMILSLSFITFATAKPLMKQDSNLIINQHHVSTAPFHNLVKRAALGSVASSKSGFAAITTTEGTENRKKSRECLEWVKKPVTNEWKCDKFRGVEKSN